MKGTFYVDTGQLFTYIWPHFLQEQTNRKEKHQIIHLIFHLFILDVIKIKWRYFHLQKVSCFISDLKLISYAYLRVSEHLKLWFQSLHSDFQYELERWFQI